jgi:protocatechuate 3,4-dioxygenase beta subunit
MRWFPLALILCAPFASAQSDANQKTIRVEGTVLSLNGGPVRKATVRLQGTSAQPGQTPTSYSEATDTAGKFVFDDVAPGRYRLSAEKTGFVTARYGARSNTQNGPPLDFTAGTGMKDLAIKMTPQGVIAGKVMDQDGDPVVSAQVQAMRSAYSGGRKQLQSNGGVQTNDLGEYRLINLAPGRYYIDATDRRAVQNSAQDRPGRSGTVQEGNITTYYPNGADPSSAVAVDVAAGAELRGMDIRLIQAKVYAVRGKTVDSSGAPPSAIVSLTRKEDSGNVLALLGGSTQQVRPDGTFEFRNIVAGTYVLQVAQIMANRDQPANVTGRVEVTVGDANIEGVVLPLIPRPEITGTLTLEDGDITSLLKPAQNTTGVAAAGNAVVPRPGRLTLNLTSTENILGNGSSAAQVNGDGTFRFDALGTTKYALNVQTPQGTYLRSARFGGQDVLHATIDTTSGTGGTLELVLSSKAATVTGSVHNQKGEALARAIVTLWPKTPDSSPTGGIRATMADQNGAFKLPSLAPGDYYIAAWEDLDSGLAQSADFLNHFSSDASATTLAEGAQESRDLKPVAADRVAAEIAKLP